jgi:hypothetical protein
MLKYDEIRLPNEIGPYSSEGLEFVGFLWFLNQKLTEQTLTFVELLGEPIFSVRGPTFSEYPNLSNT